MQACWVLIVQFGGDVFSTRPVDFFRNPLSMKPDLRCKRAMPQVLIVQLGGDVFSTRPLTGAQWAACTGIGALSLLVRAGLRLLPPHPEVQGVQQADR